MTYRLFAPARRVVRVLVVRLLACGLAACASPPPAPPRPAPGRRPPHPDRPARRGARGRAARLGDVGSAPTGTRRRPTARRASTCRSCPGNELLNNTDFDGGKYIPWTTSFTAPGNGNGFVKDGQFCVDVTNKGKDPWDAQMRHREMIIQKGHIYSIKYMAHATKPIQMKAKVGMSGPAVQGVLGRHRRSDDAPADVRRRVRDGGGRRPDRRAGVPLRRRRGGRDAGALHGLLRRHPPRRSEVREGEAKAEDAPIPPCWSTRPATCRRCPSSPPSRARRRRRSSGSCSRRAARSPRRARRKPVGKDAASGEDVHVVDFSSVTAPGKGYTLKVGADVSHPFDIARRRLHAS